MAKYSEKFIFVFAIFQTDEAWHVYLNNVYYSICIYGNRQKEKRCGIIDIVALSSMHLYVIILCMYRSFVDEWSAGEITIETGPPIFLPVDGCASYTPFDATATFVLLFVILI